MKIISSLLLLGSMASLPSIAQEIQQESKAQTIPRQVRLIFFETEDINPNQILPVQQSFKAGIPSVSVVGRGVDFNGFGSKWMTLRHALSKLPPTDIAVIADTRDVLLNVHLSKPLSIELVLAEIERKYQSVLDQYSPQAVVMGAEFQCCVAALTHGEPGSFFAANGSARKERTCWSGTESCPWGGNEKKEPWQDFMQKLAKDRTGMQVDDPYLNAGMVMGTVANLLNLIDIADFEEQEDDQAVFTDLMYARPDLIVLDYGQEVFGNARWALNSLEDGCVFDAVDEENDPLHTTHPGHQDGAGRLVHRDMHTTPLFLHTPNLFYECLDRMANLLGEKQTEDSSKLKGTMIEKLKSRRLGITGKGVGPYGGGPYGGLPTLPCGGPCGFPCFLFGPCGSPCSPFPGCGGP